MQNLQKTLILVSFLIFGQTLQAQTFADFSVGTSKQDQLFLNLALQKQFSDKFRAGIEIQTSAVNYRFIGAKVIDEGNSTSISLPSSFKLYQQDKLRLDFYSRFGLRFQSVGDSYAQEKVLQESSSVGFNAELGLLVTVLLSDKFNIQSGFTLPNVFEVTPEFIYENNVTNLFANIGYRLSDKSTFVFKANAGPAAGASGDSQKFIYGLQAGIRFAFGKSAVNNSALRIDPTYSY